MAETGRDHAEEVATVSVGEEGAAIPSVVVVAEVFGVVDGTDCRLWAEKDVHCYLWYEWRDFLADVDSALRYLPLTHDGGRQT